MRTAGLACLFILLTASASAADFSGKWQFSVDLDGGGHGEPVFVLEQKDSAISGTYSGPLGEYKVSGRAKGDEAEFGFTFEREGETLKAVYKAKLESAKKMSGTVNLGENTRGVWTATR